MRSHSILYFCFFVLLSLSHSSATQDDPTKLSKRDNTIMIYVTPANATEISNGLAALNGEDALVVFEPGFYLGNITFTSFLCKSIIFSSLGGVFFANGSLTGTSGCEVHFHEFTIADGSTKAAGRAEIVLIVAPHIYIQDSYLGATPSINVFTAAGNATLFNSTINSVFQGYLHTEASAVTVGLIGSLWINSASISFSNFISPGFFGFVIVAQNPFGFLKVSNSFSFAGGCVFTNTGDNLFVDSLFQDPLNLVPSSMGLILTNATTPLPVNTVIERCKFLGGNGASVAMVATGSLIIRDSIVDNFNNVGVYGDVNVKLEIYNTVVSNCRSSGVAGFGSIIIADSRLINNSFPRCSGALCVLLTAYVNLTRTYFYNNTGNNGAVLSSNQLFSELVVHIDSCVFEKNSVIANGGALDFPRTSSEIVIKNSEFIGNSASASGGAISFSLGFAANYAIVQNLTFINNMAGADGGGIAADGSVDKVIFNQLHFRSNVALGSGGSATLAGNSISIQGWTIEDSTAQIGGGLYLNSANEGKISIDSVYMNGGSASILGGGIVITGFISQVNVTNSIIKNLSGGYEGGGMSFIGSARVSEANLMNVSMQFNEALKGGHLAVTGIVNTLTISDCQFSDGTGGEGSFLYYDGSKSSQYRAQLPNVQIYKVVATRHVTTSLESSPVVFIGPLGTINLHEFTSSYNTGSQGKGGALSVANAQSLNISNSRIFGNFASSSGAIYLSLSDSNTAHLYNVSIYGNRGNISTGGISVVSESTNSTARPSFFFANSLLSKNSASSGSGLFFSGSFDVVDLDDLNLEDQNCKSGSSLRFGEFTAKNVSVESCTFYRNQGGAVHLDEGSDAYFSFKKCAFANNAVSDEEGGAISAKSSSPLFVVDSSFTGNSASKLNGGAIFSTSSNLTVNNCKFSSNSAALGTGGSIYISNVVQSKKRQENVESRISDSSFENGSAKRGGAIGVSGTAEITSSTFLSNAASQGNDLSLENNSKASVYGSTLNAWLDSSSSQLNLDESSSIAVVCTTGQSPKLNGGSYSCVADPPTEAVVKGNDNSVLIVSIVVPILIVLLLTIVAAVFLVLYFRKKQIEAEEKRKKNELELKNLCKDLLLEDVQVGDIIGSGHFGEVFRGFWNGTVVALKAAKSDEDEGEDKQWADEIHLIQKLNHPNIVRLLGLHAVDKSLYMVLEYMDKGSLDRYLRNTWEITQDDLFLMVYDLCKGMKYLQAKGVIHRDLAARNILVDGNKRIKISDFGMSKQEDAYQIKNKTIPYRWSAPEVINEYVARPESDVWSFGIVVWEIYSQGKIPYSDLSNSEVVKYVMDGRRLTIPDACPPFLGGIMERCWSLDPKERPTFSQIYNQIMEVNHPALIIAKQAEREAISTTGGSTRSSKRLRAPSGNSLTERPSHKSIIGQNAYAFSDSGLSGTSDDDRTPGSTPVASPRLRYNKEDEYENDHTYNNGNAVSSNPSKESITADPVEIKITTHY